jgi:energy-coupling factor transporter ATP-binding protein EcfA2
MWNLPRLFYEDRLLSAISNISSELLAEDKIIVFSTTDYKLADLIATNVMVLKDGMVQEALTKEEFTTKWDDLKLTLQVEWSPFIRVKLKKFDDACAYCRVVDDKIEVYKDVDLIKFLEIIDDFGIVVKQISRNSPNISNAMMRAI